MVRRWPAPADKESVLKIFAPRVMALAIASALAFSAVHAAPSPRAENAFLSQGDAAARSARVSNVDYALEFTLTGKESFSGVTTAMFDLADNAQPLTIDLDKATVKSVQVNGKQVDAKYNNWFVTIPAANLVKGRNTVVIAYERLQTGAALNPLRPDVIYGSGAEGYTDYASLKQAS